MNNTIQTYYRDHIDACAVAIRKLQNNLNGLSLLRVLFFAALCWNIYALAHGFSRLLLLTAVGFAGLFVGCLNLYYRWKDERNLLEKLRFVSTNELNVHKGEANGFPDGAAYLDNDNYLDDLDIFGRHSLFHALNRTTSLRGASRLATRLREPILVTTTIIGQQAAIRVLAAQTQVRQLLTATGLVAQETGPSNGPGASPEDLDSRGLREWLDEPPRLSNRLPWRIGIYLFGVFSLYAFYRAFDSYQPLFVVIAIVVARLILAFFGKYTGLQHLLIARKQAVLDQYAGILRVFNKTDAKDSALLQHLLSHTGKAHRSLRRLSRLSNAFDQRMNLVVSLLLNNFFLYDLYCLIALEKWKAANRSEFLDWLDAVATVESLNSLATFAFNNPDTIYPTPVPSDPLRPSDSSEGPTATDAAALFIETTRLAHPLIPAARRIANDITIGRQERLILVTGSNMSGKTTFLRTLGVNLLMAQCGLPVCAATFTFTPMRLLTSLRISDSLQEQTSYFMAELKKLQRIIHRLETGDPALVLIDEILRGTNSEDKSYGSEQFILKLLQYPCLSLFATHDLSLGQLEQTRPGAVRNYCFESIIEAGELYFDYRLQRGIASNRNASFLMKKMDII